MQIRLGTSLKRLHEKGSYKKHKKKKNPLDGKPFAKGVVIKTLIRKPKKPNSANRKCVLVRLSTGKEMVAFIPGEYIYNECFNENKMHEKEEKRKKNT